MRRVWLGILCVALVTLAVSPARAGAAFDDPLFVFTPQPPAEPPFEPPPVGYFNGPCGLTVGSNGWFYVSDYYHRAIDVFDPLAPSPDYKGTPLIGAGSFGDHTGPVDDPCGLAFDGSGTLYLNNYHRDVVRFPSPLSLGTGAVIDSGDPLDSAINPTGVAVDPVTDDVYVNNRTYVSVYDSNGDPVLDGSDPLRIGVGDLGDGYGIAASPSGKIYVPDASDDTVKVFDTTTHALTATITGPPDDGFASLQDAAIAVDEVTGEVYVTDTLGPQLTEQPLAVVYVFSAAGAFEGRLKHSIVNAAPAGLAVDNSGGAGQSHVYVTSGITENASVYAYPAGAATSAEEPPLGSTLSLLGGSGGSSGGGSSAAHASVAPDGDPDAGPVLSAADSSSITQKGTLRVAVAGKLSPKRLPRSGVAPISVSVGGKISTTDQSLPPQLKTLRIELNRHGKLDSKGLPTCPYNRIQPGSSSRALSVCRAALVGKGSFTADITLAGQEPYPTKGRLLVFNGAQGRKSVLFGHIYAPRPFATSFVIVFEIQKLGKGVYGTALNAPMPKAMDAWGRLTSLEMTLSRRYSAGGRRHSFVSSGCPAPKGFPGATFPLARTSFAFSEGQKLTSVLNGSCKVR